MRLFFKKVYLKSAERQGWDLVPDKSAHITTHSVRTIMDAGTGNGERLAYFLHSFPYAVIHCFEPEFKAFTGLEKKYRNHRRVLLNRMALCGSSGLNPSGLVSEPCRRPGPVNDTADLSLQQHMVKTTVDDYCRVCGINEIDILRLPGTATEVALFNGARMQLADGTIKSLLIPFRPGAAEEQAAVTEIAALNRGLEHKGFSLKGVRGGREAAMKFYGHMLYIKKELV